MLSPGVAACLPLRIPRRFPSCEGLIKPSSSWHGGQFLLRRPLVIEFRFHLDFVASGSPNASSKRDAPSCAIPWPQFVFFSGPTASIVPSIIWPHEWNRRVLWMSSLSSCSRQNVDRATLQIEVRASTFNSEISSTTPRTVVQRIGNEVA